MLTVPSEPYFRLDAEESLLRNTLRDMILEGSEPGQGKIDPCQEIPFEPNEKVSGWSNTLFENPLIGKLGFVDVDKLQNAYTGYLTERPDVNRSTIFPALIFELWLRQYSNQL